jgi:hypothetical protein
MMNLVQTFRQTFPNFWLNKLADQVIKQYEQTQQQVLLGLVTAELTNIHTGKKTIIPGLNIVTTKGDVYYAQLAMGDTITNDFQGAGAGLRLGSDSTAPTKADTDVGTFLTGSDHAIDVGYPKSNDADVDNTGSGLNVMTWTYSYSTAEGNVTGIAEGGISDVRAGPSTALLTHFLFASTFTKTSSDTLKVIVNHSVVGV